MKSKLLCVIYETLCLHQWCVYWFFKSKKNFHTMPLLKGLLHFMQHLRQNSFVFKSLKTSIKVTNTVDYWDTVKYWSRFLMCGLNLHVMMVLISQHLIVCPCSTEKMGISIKWLWRKLTNEIDWSLELLELSRTSHSAYLHPSIIFYCESLRVTWTTWAGHGSSSKDQPRVGVDNGLNFLTTQLCSLCTSYREDKTNNFQPIFLVISPVVLLESPRIKRVRNFWKSLGLNF